MVFVSYSHAGNHGHGFGSCTSPIHPLTYADVATIKASIERDSGFDPGTVVVLNWIPLPKEPCK
jgi:hypothetical protein